MTPTVRNFALPVAAIAVGATLAGCGSSGGKATAGNRPPPTRPTGAAATVALRTTGLGRVLTDATGQTLYLLTADRGSHFACTASCIGFWPPLVQPNGAPKAGAGVTGTLGLVSRPEGGRQVTIAGHPLYTYSGDSTAGQTKGEGVRSFGGVWYAVSATGAPITSTTSGSTPSPTSGGYNY